MKKYITLLAGILITNNAIASAPDTLWTRTFGGTGYEYGRSVQQTKDDGFIIVGSTSSSGAGASDVYLIKTNSSGDTLWTKTYGGTGNDYGNSVQQTSDGGFIIAGQTYSFGAGNYDVYLIKTDSSGTLLWAKTFGGTSTDHGKFVQQTSDGGFIITGETYSFGAGNYDVYLIRTNSSGNTLWTKIFGGANSEVGNSVRQTIDSGFIIVGSTCSFGSGTLYYPDIYLIKTNSSGDTLWTKTYGGTSNDGGNSVQQTQDSGFIIAGTTLSFGAGGDDVYLIKTNSSGDTLWTKTFGGTNTDYGNSVQQTQDSGFIIGGSTISFGAGGNDAYLIKTNSSGDTLWTKNFGGTDHDYVNSVQQIRDGGFILAGYTKSFGAGNEDIWFIKIKPCINLISPNGSENLVGGSTHLITWDIEGTGFASYRLLFSTNGGSSYPDTIAKNVSSDSTHWSWILPSINCTTCRVKAQILNVSGNAIFEDASDSNFTIEFYTTLTSPDSGETWIGGSTHPITWAKEGTGFASYRLLFSTNGGSSYPDTIAKNISPDSTHWNWTLPVINNTTCRVKIQMLNNSSNVILEDASKFNFEIWAGYYLANSQYPMFHYDLAHTGKAPYHGATSNNIKWYFATGSPVISSPIVGPDGTIYFTSENDTLYALNIDGTKKWAKSLGTATKSTPVIAIDSTIYVPNDYGLLACWSNGTTKWEYYVFGSIVSSPAIGSDGVIYFGSNNDTVYAVNADGTSKWKFGTGGDIESSPAISPDGIVYIGSNDNNLYAINPNGTQKWSVNTSGVIVSSPLIDTSTGKIYVGSGNGKLYSINPNGTIAKTFTTGNAITSSPALSDSTIFFGSYALDLDLNLKWSYQTGGETESSPVIDANGHIYIGSYDGTFYCFKDSDTALIWSALTGNAIESSPTIAANGCVYVGSNDGRVYAFGTNAPVQVISPNGGEKWKKSTVHNICWSTTGSIVNIKLLYSLDSGTSWHLISNSEIDDGIYPWTLPDTLSSQCRVKAIAFDAGGDSAIDISDGDFEIGNIGIETESTIPKVFFLSQSYPNPMASGTYIKYGLPQSTEVTMAIYDLTGRTVRTLAAGNQKAGNYGVYWNGKDNSGNKVSAGVYFCKMQAGDFKATRKLTILR